MTHSNIFKTVLTVIAIVAMAFAAPQPNKSDLSNEIIPSGGFATKNGNTVSANWGGFQAAASLADDGTGATASASGNGLNAGAGYAPATAFAGAGVIDSGNGNTGAFYGAGYGGKPGSGKPGSGNHHQQYQQDGTGVNGGGFFDRIFAIPINVLQSVNTYLNQKQQSGTTVHGQPGKPAAPGTVSASAASSGGSYADKEPNAAGPDYGHGKTGGAPMTVHANKNYDEVFNIPITALRSVQNLLNG